MYWIALFPLFTAVARASLAYKGVDWSSLLVEEAAGHSYKTASGTVQPLETILKANGVNTVRQRLWVNPSNGEYDLAYNLKLAKRAHAAGLNVYLDFHFSDSWADPSKQTTPVTMNSFHSAGIPLSLVSIGNEITAGMLWPLGDMSQKGGSHNLARLLHSASAGIKDSDLTKKPLIMTHLDNGWNYATQEYWYDTVLAQGPFTSSDFDIQGVSYYPFYNSEATLASLKSSLTNMKKKYKKSIMVVETDWPTACSHPAYAFPSDTKKIPFSPAGQTQWMETVASEVVAAGGDGLFYWEPMWIDNAGLGSSCEYNLMVETNGKIESSLSVFKKI
ncbi:Arabinogalactan endo-beta-1,4-galactanase [Acrodontium crateriforme]|uniref:Arabinogalactan endo-beta-1,4-galactanase n=1 Tax=Acrodontium crateriforme TaxID=150365 RepID=A0AAQ3M1S7_9PEZI|nr:Arabinogalactan endo-beta-1,4-galactanase [Acrodontium crateriforme]